MSNDDEFDLQIRVSPNASGLGDSADRRIADEARDFDVFGGGEQAETVAPQATCPADTCGLDCQTIDCTFGCETHGCNTSETCDQVVCSDAITFGPYCEDQSDDTCSACPEPNTPGCADPPD